MSLTFSRYVRFIFHVCPVLALRVISLHLPSCRLVSLCFVSLSFPLHSPCFHFCPFHVPFSSPLFPFHFPLLSCHVDFLCPPLISLHFLAFPLCSPVFPAKKTRFSSSPAFSQRGRPKTHRFSAKGGRKPKPANEPAGGIEPEGLGRLAKLHTKTRELTEYPMPSRGTKLDRASAMVTSLNCKRFALPASAQPSLREGSGTPKSSVGKVRILLRACDRTSSPVLVRCSEAVLLRSRSVCRCISPAPRGRAGWAGRAG